MTAYYNENDPFAAAWLRELIEEGLIADGHVDDRSIGDVTPNDLRGYAQHHFFAGIGGWSLALRLAAWPDHRPVWTGSCPCQPFSRAGKQGGFADERHLWPFWQYLIAQRRPAVVYGEQVASASDWLRLVRGDLEAMDYAVGAIPVEAASAGADHLRDRYWFVADINHARPQGRQLLPERAGGWSVGPRGLEHDPRERRGEGRTEHEVRSGRSTVAESSILVDARSEGSRRHGGTVFGAQAEGARERESAGHFADKPEPASIEWVIGADGKARRVESGVRLLADGFPGRVGLLRGLGNAIDPRPAAAFIKSTM